MDRLPLTTTEEQYVFIYVYMQMYRLSLTAAVDKYVYIYIHIYIYVHMQMNRLSLNNMRSHVFSDQVMIMPFPCILFGRAYILWIPSINIIIHIYILYIYSHQLSLCFAGSIDHHKGLTMDAQRTHNGFTKDSQENVLIYIYIYIEYMQMWRTHTGFTPKSLKKHWFY